MYFWLRKKFWDPSEYSEGVEISIEKKLWHFSEKIDFSKCFTAIYNSSEKVIKVSKQVYESFKSKFSSQLVLSAYIFWLSDFIKRLGTIQILRHAENSKISVWPPLPTSRYRHILKFSSWPPLAKKNMFALCL